MAKLAIPAILWIATLWRARSALQNPAKRPMWTAFAALAVSLTADLPQVGSHLDSALGITNISALIKQIAGMVAAAAVLEWVIGSTQPTRRLGRVLAWRHVMTGAAMATLGILFAFVPRIETSYFVDTAPGHPVTIAYEMVWLSYLGIAMLCAAAMFTVAWRRSTNPQPLMRTSFAVLAAGTALGVVYAACRISILAASLAGAVTASQGDTAFSLTEGLQYAAIITILAGTCFPALATVASFREDRRDLIALRPLWELVTQSRPDTVLDAEPSGENELRNLRMLRFRLIRRAVEIRDALAALYEYCELDPAPHAEAFAAGLGLTGIEQQALVEAVTIRYALMCSRSGVLGNSNVKAGRGGSDLRSEVAWLRAVSQALDNGARMQTAMIPVLTAHSELMEAA